jgi:hypothetical protein
MEPLDLRPAFLDKLLPPLQTHERLSPISSDTIIHAPGFEDRTLAIADAISTTNRARAILLDYLPYSPKNRLREVRDAITAKGIEVREKDIVSYNRFEPGDFEVRLQARLRAHQAGRVILDISSMSKLAIMLVLNTCHILDVEVAILYAEAQTYAPSKEHFEIAKEKREIHRPTLQVYTGVHGVVRVDSLASVAMQGQPTAALVFMSFNDVLTQVLLNTVYPGRLFLINGRPPKHRWREAATAWIHDQVRREWQDDNPVERGRGYDVPLPKRVTSTLDYRETVALLLELYWDLSPKHRILLAPAGSKMQAVGCYIIKALHPDIHVEYPSPEGFSHEYSLGIGHRWILNFGHLSKRVSAIAAAERREYLEILT